MSSGSRPSPGATDPGIQAVYDRAMQNDIHVALYTPDIIDILAAADAAREAAGIVRVDTRDEATVERLRNIPMAWIHGDAEDFARAVLAALRGEQ